MICPLISLMEDQLMVLEKLGISAALLNASSSKVCSTVKSSQFLCAGLLPLCIVTLLHLFSNS